MSKPVPDHREDLAELLNEFAPQLPFMIEQLDQLARLANIASAHAPKVMVNWDADHWKALTGTATLTEKAKSAFSNAKIYAREKFHLPERPTRSASLAQVWREYGEAASRQKDKLQSMYDLIESMVMKFASQEKKEVHIPKSFIKALETEWYFAPFSAIGLATFSIESARADAGDEVFSDEYMRVNSEINEVLQTLSEFSSPRIKTVSDLTEYRLSSALISKPILAFHGAAMAFGSFIMAAALMAPIQPRSIEIPGIGKTPKPNEAITRAGGAIIGGMMVLGSLINLGFQVSRRRELNALRSVPVAGTSPEEGPGPQP